MKTSELMIGDLLYLNRRPVRVDAIGFNGSISYSEKGGFGSIGVDKLSPIPITEEILVKNGFDKDERSKYYHEYILELELWDFDISWTNAGGFKYEDIRLDYVHQLQRLLNLCNIDKEIIL